MSFSVEQAIGEAVLQNPGRSSEGVLERVFARMFRGLVYAQIWEDPVCDMAALQITEQDNVVCIASGGCNMMSYLTANPASVLAVDLSPAHVMVNRLKIKAAKHLPDHATFYSLFGHADRKENKAYFEQYLIPYLTDEELDFWQGRMAFRYRFSMFSRGFYRFGALGVFLRFVHLLMRKIDFDPLLTAQSLEEQQAFFDAQIAPLFDTKLVRFLARRRGSLFGLGIPPAQYEKLAADAGGDVLPVLKERTRKLFCDFPINDNYFAWQAANRGYRPDGKGSVPPYLEAQHFDTVSRNASRADVVNGSLTDVLSAIPDNAKSVYLLLDAQDWMNDEQLTALWTQITRTAAPGARVLFRTGGEDDILPGRVADEVLSQWTRDAEVSETAFRTDRSAIYGGVHLYRLNAG